LLTGFLVMPANAQSNADSRAKAEAAAFYLRVTCNTYHRDEFLWDPAITVARQQGLADGKPIPKDLRLIMKQTSQSDLNTAQLLLNYKWPSVDIATAIKGISDGFLQDSRDIGAIASQNKWRTPDWSMWWQDDDVIRRKLGLSLSAGCPGWDWRADEAHYYIGSVCPAEWAFQRYLKARDRAVRAGMKVDGSMPNYLIETMLTAAIYFERAGFRLSDLDSDDDRVNADSRQIAKRDYWDADEFLAIAKTKKWREPRWATGYAEPAARVRAALGLPPPLPSANACPQIT
jgi:hypothetical protein